MVSWSTFETFYEGSRDWHGGTVPLADGASGVQAVDDCVAPTLLFIGVIPLGSDIVATVTERSEFVNGCLRIWYR